MTPPTPQEMEMAREALRELGYTTVYHETGTLAFYPKDLDRMIQKFADKLSTYGQQRFHEGIVEEAKNCNKHCEAARQEALEDAAKVAEKEYENPLPIVAVVTMRICKAIRSLKQTPTPTKEVEE